MSKPKSKIISTRFNPTDLKKAKKLAKSRGMKLTQYIRYVSTLEKDNDIAEELKGKDSLLKSQGIELENWEVLARKAFHYIEKLKLRSGVNLSRGKMIFKKADQKMKELEKKIYENKE